ncbi:MAG TPA: rod shape-determining protein MreC [Persephonella sp.]|uniref:Cell shape-determining protein MreC n=1 Tax=Persephonella marina (strain DSM 14350 / EX-H1) TaxID=123214 RepID=C0QT39_PERMH|nr:MULTISPECIES: rod shape-determining protein MreC [Persephonella]ACO03681.1 rod shape-determining protein MreC [Persephonella marina EX-H1]HCB70527.1 rod shape-determining protein MreC [Persephonella sp.]
MFKKKGFKRVTLFVVIVLSISVVYLFLIPNSKGAVLTVFHPFLKAVDGVYETFSSVIRSVEDNYRLYRENKELKKEIERLKGEITLLKQYEIENQRLSSIANFKKRFKKYRLLTGKVIGFSPDNWSNFLIINLGKKSGIKKGDLVVSDGYLLGIVYSVGPFSSSVLLVSDKNFRIPARTRKTRELVFFQGKDLKSGVLKYVKPQQDIRIGDIIETTDVGKNYPPGIPIGKIKSINYEEGDFFKNVDIKLDINPLSVEYVVVITKREKSKKR